VVSKSKKTRNPSLRKNRAKIFFFSTGFSPRFFAGFFGAQIATFFAKTRFWDFRENTPLVV
jgi:hypothetical protein